MCGSIDGKPQGRSPLPAYAALAAERRAHFRGGLCPQWHGQAAVPATAFSASNTMAPLFVSWLASAARFYSPKVQQRIRDIVGTVWSLGAIRMFQSFAIAGRDGLNIRPRSSTSTRAFG
jgi:hypothetical protein